MGRISTRWREASASLRTLGPIGPLGPLGPVGPVKG